MQVGSSAASEVERTSKAFTFHVVTRSIAAAPTSATANIFDWEGTHGGSMITREPLGGSVIAVVILTF